MFFFSECNGYSCSSFGLFDKNVCRQFINFCGLGVFLLFIWVVSALLGSFGLSTMNVYGQFYNLWGLGFSSFSSG
jgi:hypothetical protein